MSFTVKVSRENYLTANQRLHWSQRAKRTKHLRRLTHYLAGAVVVPFDRRVACVVDVAWPDARRRDVHNIMPTVKACIDGLVDAGWLTDDSDKYLQGPDLRPTDDRCSKDLACALTFTFEEIA